MPRERRPAPQPETAGPQRPKFPQRDAAGRVGTLPDLLVGVLVWLLVALALLLLIDGAAWLIGQGFGGTSGWIAGLLAVWLFAEEFRAWRPVPARGALAAVAAFIAGAMGVATTGLAAALPKLVSGFLGVSVAALAYALLWYYGVRWLARRSGEG
jgi:hypothetical protein